MAKWSNFDPAWRAAAVEELARVALIVNDPPARERLRDGLRSLVRNHRNFAQADWALDGEDLAPLEAILDGMTAGSAAERHRWLFRTPDFFSMHSPYEEAAQLRTAQQEAAENLLAELDDNSIMAFAETIRLRQHFGDAIGSSTASHVRKRLLLALSLDLDGNVGSELSSGLLLGLSRGPGRPWLEALWDEGVTARWSNRALLRVALQMPGDELNWARLDAGPPSVKAAYWAELPTFRVELTAPLPIAAEHLIAAGRAHAAVYLLGHRIGEGPPADLLVKALRAAGHERPSDDANDVVMFSHFLGIILDHLDQNSIVTELQVVELEWQYFDLLRHSTRPPRRLSKALATYPEFFVQLLCLLWGPSPEGGVQEPEPEDRAVAQALASHAFYVLNEWSWVPGADESGAIDGGALNAWLNTSRKLCQEKGRAEAGDRQIGDILAAASGQGTAAWPPDNVRNAIEHCRSRPLERGFQLGVFNRRGVTVRRPLAGGDQERDWANYFRDQGRRFEISWERTAQLLDRIADMYEADARDQDDWTEQRETMMGGATLT